MSALAAAALVAALTAAPASDCGVQDATLDWGFKESFRSYISGSIANGEWTVADGASYETPSFGWSGAEGSYDGGEGEVAFTGSITFTGHGGILNTTVSDPRIEFDGDTALLYLDVVGTTQAGEEVASEDVPFATLDLADRVSSNGMVTVTAPAVLTSDGAAAFGTYEAGEELDPVSVSFTVPEECSAADSASSWILPAAAALLLGLVGAVLLVLRRRRQGAGA